MADDDGAQPDEGQGAPYAEYLEQLPEEVRGQVEPVFKEWDGNVTKRFQEASEYKKSWEPYESLGVNQVPADHMKWLMDFRETALNPEQYQAWIASQAQELGLTAAEQQQFEDNPEVQALVEQQLQQALGPLQGQLGQLTEWQQSQQEAEQQRQGQAEVERQLSALQEKHKDAVPDLETLEPFAMRYAESDPANAIARGYQDFQKIRADIEKGFVGDKLGAPPGAESGGVADTSPEKVTTLKEAAALATERLRQTASQ